MERSRKRPDNPWARLVTGAAILAVGTIFWLDHLDKIESRDFFRWWPVALIAYGLAHLAERRWAAAGVLSLLGVLLLPQVQLFTHIRLSQIIGAWPILITVAGLTLVAQALRPKPKDAASRGSFRALAIMGGNNRSIASDEFVGGDVVAIMGGCEIDLRSAPPSGEVVIDVLAFWGGINFTVPHGWKIENRIAVILGAVLDETVAPPSSNVAPASAGGSAPRLVLRGSAIMGSVEVRNPKEARA